MQQVIQFREISDFVKKMNLKVTLNSSDFLVVNHKSLSSEEIFCKNTAFRQNYFEICLESNSTCGVQVDQFDVSTASNRLTLISPNRLLHITNNEELDSCDGYSIFFKQTFIQKLGAIQQFLTQLPFFNPKNTPSLALDTQEVIYFKDIIQKIHYEYQHNHLHSEEIIKNYLNILFLKAQSHYKKEEKRIIPISRTQEIYNEFEWLVLQHFTKKTSVSFYAEKMNISPKYLSEIIKKITGKSALQIIHENRIDYAKTLLLKTRKTITEIAYELHFENKDYFSVFFKRHTEKSPSEYRIS